MTQNVVKAVLDQQEECSAISEIITHVSRRSLLPLLNLIGGYASARVI